MSAYDLKADLVVRWLIPRIDRVHTFIVCNALQTLHLLHDSTCHEDSRAKRSTRDHLLHNSMHGKIHVPDTANSPRQSLLGSLLSSFISQHICVHTLHHKRQQCPFQPSSSVVVYMFSQLSFRENHDIFFQVHVCSAECAQKNCSKHSTCLSQLLSPSPSLELFQELGSFPSCTNQDLIYLSTSWYCASAQPNISCHPHCKLFLKSRSHHVSKAGRVKLSQ